jgi:hypothetical protein
MSLNDDYMTPSISEVEDIDYTGKIPQIDVGKLPVSCQDYKIPCFKEGSGLHSSDLFDPYHVFDPSVQNRREQDLVLNGMNGVTKEKPKEISQENTNLINEVREEYERLKEEIDAEAEVHWEDGRSETFDINLRPSADPAEIMTKPSIVILDSQDSRKQMALREWRPISDQLLSDVNRMFSKFKRTQHDGAAHESLGTPEFDPEEFTESTLAMDERELQVALNGQEGIYNRHLDKEGVAPVTPVEIALTDVKDDSAYALRPFLPNIYDGSIQAERYGKKFGEWYANMANLGLLSYVDREHEFYKDSVPNKDGSHLAFVDNEMIFYTEDEMHFIGGDDYKHMEETLYKICLDPDMDHEELGFSSEDVFNEGPAWSASEAQKLVNQWKDTYGEVYEKLPEIDLLEHLHGFDPEVFGPDKRIVTRVG